MPSNAHDGPEYQEQLAAMVAEMPRNAREKARWYRRRRNDPGADQRLLRHAFWGTDDGWDDDALSPPDPMYLRNIEPGWMWARADRNSRRNYVTSGYALNLSDPDEDVGRADWHPQCWQVPLTGVHPRARDCIAAQWTPLRGDGHYDETWHALGDRGVFDARPAFRELGHPAGDWGSPVWAANHPRAIIDQAWNALRAGIVPVERHVTPYLVARWLWTDEQFEELAGMAGLIASSIGRAYAPAWRHWAATLSPEAAWRDDPDNALMTRVASSDAPTP